MNTDNGNVKEGAEVPQNKNKAELHFRAIDWAATPRPRLHDLLLELEVAENTGTRYSGVTIWRNGLSFILAGPWLAVSAARWRRPCSQAKSRRKIWRRHFCRSRVNRKSPPNCWTKPQFRRKPTGRVCLTDWPETNFQKAKSGQFQNLLTT